MPAKIQIFTQVNFTFSYLAFELRAAVFARNGSKGNARYLLRYSTDLFVTWRNT